MACVIPFKSNLFKIFSCFSFVFYVTYKVIGGFPGYLFQY